MTDVDRFITQTSSLETLSAHERAIQAATGKLSRAQLDLLLDAFERACCEQGETRYRVYWQRQLVAWFRGEEQQADAFAELMRGVPLPADRCRICDLNFEIRRIAQRGDYERALRLSEPILSGAIGCDTAPARTYPSLLYPLLHVGRKVDAERCFRAGRVAFDEDPPRSKYAGDFLRYLALVEAWDEGIALLERHLAPPEAYALPSDAFAVYEGAWLLTEKLRQDGREHVALHALEPLPVANLERRGVSTAELADWVWSELTRIAREYDRVNETPRFAEMLASTAELLNQSFTPRAVDEPTPTPEGAS